MLNNDITRCANKKCTKKCRRKEPSNAVYQAYSQFGSENGKGKCEYQIYPYKKLPKLTSEEKSFIYLIESLNKGRI